MRNAKQRLAIDMSLDHFKDRKIAPFAVKKGEIDHILDELENLGHSVYSDTGIYRSNVKSYLKKLDLALAAVLYYKDLEGRAVEYKKILFLHNLVNERLYDNQAFNAYCKSLEDNYLDKKKTGLDASSALRKFFRDLPDKVFETVEKIGDMRIHFVGEIPNEEKKSTLAEIKKAYDLVKASDVPKIAETLYGDVFVFAPGAKKWMGLFDHSFDIVYLSYLDGKVKQNLIHELGHRYYRTVLEPRDKSNWEEFKNNLTTNAKMREYSKSIKPKVGESLGLDYGVFFGSKVEKIIPGHNDRITEIRKDQDGSITDIFVDEYWFTLKEFTQIGYAPSAHGLLDSEEYFCEVLAQYISGSIRPSVKELLTKGFREHFIDPYKDHKDPDVIMLPKIPDNFIILPPAEYKQAINSLRNILNQVQFISPATMNQAKEYLDIYEPISQEQPPLYIDKGVLDFISETNKHISVEVEKRREQVYPSRPSQSTPRLPLRKVNAEPTIEEMLDFCLQNGDSSEVKFTRSIANQYYRDGALSEMQKAHLKGNYLLIKKRIN